MKPTPPLTSQDVKTIRRELGLTQTELATLIGVSRGAVAFWEAGTYVPSPVSCYALRAARIQEGT